MTEKITFGIKLHETRVSASVLMMIKRELGVPPSEAKARIAKGSYVFTCSNLDDAGIASINKATEAFLAQGLHPHVYMSDIEMPLGFLANVERRNREIDNEFGLGLNLDC